jgi:hypothetical protein
LIRGAREAAGLDNPDKVAKLTQVHERSLSLEKSTLYKFAERRERRPG